MRRLLPVLFVLFVLPLVGCGSPSSGSKSKTPTSLGQAKKKARQTVQQAKKKAAKERKSAATVVKKAKQKAAAQLKKAKKKIATTKKAKRKKGNARKPSLAVGKRCSPKRKKAYAKAGLTCRTKGSQHVLAKR